MRRSKPIVFGVFAEIVFPFAGTWLYRFAMKLSDQVQAVHVDAKSAATK
jgi:hypothetical protein